MMTILNHNVKNAIQYRHAAQAGLTNKDVSHLSARAGMSGGVGGAITFKKNC